MMKKTREQWKEVIEDQKASGLSIEKYCVKPQTEYI